MLFSYPELPTRKGTNYIDLKSLSKNTEQHVDGVHQENPRLISYRLATKHYYNQQGLQETEEKDNPITQEKRGRGHGGSISK